MRKDARRFVAGSLLTLLPLLGIPGRSGAS